ncbi:MAG TPA: DUF4287 domain-containing protein [Anaerolineales bacterium]|nr:DUF4287 domain-containing protein [Anaerolineales bacterium]
MSFQAYLDNIEEKTGKTPKQFIAEAKKLKITDFNDIIAWLKRDYDLGTGHARAIAYVIRNGAEFELKHTTGVHRDASGTLNLEGKAKQKKAVAKKPVKKTVKKK